MTQPADNLSQQYFADTQDGSVELQRLTRLAEFYDPMSQAWLDEIGLPQPGMNILEFGTGVGSLLSWFRNRAGPEARITGIDLTPRLSDHPDAEIRQGNIFDPAGEPATYDLVHARLLLEHLADPARAVSRMMDWCAPGGILAIADLDCGCVISADRDHADASRFNADVTEIRKAIAATELMDPDFGNHLAPLLKDAGLDNIQTRRFDRIVESGSDWARFQAENNLIIGRQIGVEAAAERVADRMTRPGFRYHDQALVCVSGTKT